MKTEKLVEMANDIAAFFRVEPDHKVAVDGVANHLRKFWEPRMRNTIIAHVQAGGAGLDDIAREAITQLAAATKKS